MATLGNILNTIECGASASLGTGLKGCKTFFKKATSLWITQAGFEFDSARTLDATYIDELKASGDLIVLKGVRTFTDNSGDDNIEELEDGLKSVTRLGLYEFAAKFVNGLYFHKALHSLNSQGDYDVLFVDRDGAILGTESTNGKLKGFSVGMLQGDRLEWATDSASQKEGIMFQLTERAELDSDFIYISPDQLAGFNPNKVVGVNEVKLSFAVAPADAATSLTIKAVRAQDGAVFGGLPAANWGVYINGTKETVTGDDSATAGTYVLTVPAMSTNDVVEVEFFDNNNKVVTLSGDQYKASKISATVV